ncbi:hypothetical protein [Labrys neptuniae]
MGSDNNQYDNVPSLFDNIMDGVSSFSLDEAKQFAHGYNEALGASYSLTYNPALAKFAAARGIAVFSAQVYKNLDGTLEANVSGGYGLGANIAVNLNRLQLDTFQVGFVAGAGYNNPGRLQLGASAEIFSGIGYDTINDNGNGHGAFALTTWVQGSVNFGFLTGDLTTQAQVELGGGGGSGGTHGGQNRPSGQRAGNVGGNAPSVTSGGGGARPSANGTVSNGGTAVSRPNNQGVGGGGAKPSPSSSSGITPSDAASKDASGVQGANAGYPLRGFVGPDSYGYVAGANDYVTVNNWESKVVYDGLMKMYSPEEASSILIKYMKLRNEQSLSPAEALNQAANNHCFPAGTIIKIHDGPDISIEMVGIGDGVSAYDPDNKALSSKLISANVKSIFSNITTEWLVLSVGLVVTPGHRFYNEYGEFERIDSIVARGGQIVREDGALELVTGEQVVYTEENRHLYEEAEEVVYYSIGGNALQPQIKRGWRTYNFEVEGIHTYIAGGFRVHNDSLADYNADLATMARDSGVAVGYTDAAKQFGSKVAAGMAWAIGGPVTTDTNYANIAARALAQGDTSGYHNAVEAQTAITQAAETAFRAAVDAYNTNTDWNDQSIDKKLDENVQKSLNNWNDQKEKLNNTINGSGNYSGGDHGGMNGSGGYSGNNNTDHPARAYGPGSGGSQHSGEQPDPKGNGGGGKPVLLDLNGDGLRVDTLSSSTQFLDFNGDGYRTRTAWAGKGDGILIFDADGDGKISNSREFAFTEWDPTADSDLDALKNVFDTNHNGKLDAGDTNWANFKVMVDGQVVSLASLGIQSIDLTPTGSGQTFNDGSKITGTTTFIRTDGSTGVVGDAVLATETGSYIVKQTKTTNADGSVTTDILGYDKDGSEAFENLVTVSADGTSKTIKYDDNGDGVFDRSQTVVDSKWQTYSNVETVSNYNADGSLRNSTTTQRATDLRWTKTEVDQNGDGIIDQSQIQTIEADNSRSTTTKNLAANGSTINQTLVTSSVDGLTKTTKVDHAGSGTFDQIEIDATVINADGSRTETVTDTGGNGTILGKTVTTIGPYRANSTIQIDHTGSGTFDTVENTSRSVQADGTISTWITTRNTDGSERTIHVVNLSADGLTKTEYFDWNSDGPADEIRFDGTVIAGDGTRTQTVWDKSGNGTLLSQTVTTTSADRKTITTTTDANGDGTTDQTVSIVTAADGSTTKTVSNFASNGTLISRTLTITSADGLTKTTKTDINGDGTYDLINTDVIVKNADGSSTETVTSTSANGTLADKTITTTSANGLTQTVQSDLDGNGTIDRTATDVIVLNADGSRTETVSVSSNTGALLSRTVTTDSANRLTSTISIDGNGDGHVDETQVAVVNVDGSATTTISDFAANGSLIGKTLTTVSANRLSKTTQVDVTGDGVYDGSTSDVIALNADGSKTETQTSYSADGSLLSKTVTVASGNGLSLTTQADVNGDGIFDVKTTDVTAINTDGSRTETVSNYNGAGTVLLNQSTVTTSGNGLSKTVARDINGDGATDETLTHVITLNADGSTSETAADKSGNGTLLSQTVTTTSADRKTITTTTDANGDGTTDQTVSIVTAADGSTTKTVSNFASNGTLISRTLTITSADGLTKTTKTDINGDGTYDLINTDVIVKNADGSSTETVTSTSANGTLADKTITTTSANGLTQTVQSDLDGNGTIDRTATDVIVLNADGSRTETVSVSSNTGALLSRTVTTDSANRLTSTISIDGNGDGHVDETQVAVVNVDGSATTTISDFAANGSLIGKTLTTVSANRLSKTTQVDVTGDGVYDGSTSDVIALNADGSKTETQTSYSADGSLLSKTVTVASGNGLSLTTQADVNGDGIFDVKTTDVTAINTDGSRTETVSNYNGAGTVLLNRTATTVSANGLSVTTVEDIDGNGTTDQTVADAKILNADGSTSETVSTKAGNGTLITQKTTTISADKRTTSINTDVDGDGYVDQARTITVNADGSVTTADKTYLGTGFLASKSTKVVSADGLSSTQQIDLVADGTIDFTITDVTVINADGSKTETYSDYLGTTFLRGKTITTTSVNGLSIIAQMDGNGDGTIDRTMTSVKAFNVDGSVTTTVANNNGNGSLHDKTIATVSADQMTTTLTRDLNGDGVVDQTTVTRINADGSVTTSGMDGTVKSASGRSYGGTRGSYKTVSANGLSATIQYDANGDGLAETQITDVVVLNADGSKVETITDSNLSGGVATSAAPVYTVTTKDKTVITTSADGLNVSKQFDLDGNGSFDAGETSQVTLNSDGSKIGTHVYSKAGVETGRYVATTSGNGLSIANTWTSGTLNQNQTDTTTINADGTTTRDVISNNGATLMSRTTTTTSADGRTVTTSFDTDGVGGPDKSVSTKTVAYDAGLTIVYRTDKFQDGHIERTDISTNDVEKTFTIAHDINTDGVNDQIDNTFHLADGSTNEYLDNYALDGSKLNEMKTTTSFDGLKTDISWDNNGDGTIDNTRSITRVYNADGSYTETTKDYQTVNILPSYGGRVSVNWGTSSTSVLLMSTTTTVSADGKTRTTTVDFAGTGTNFIGDRGFLAGAGSYGVARAAAGMGYTAFGSFNHASWNSSGSSSGFGTHQTLTTVKNIDGSTTLTVTNDAAAKALTPIKGRALWNSVVATSNKTVASKMVQTTSADGLSTSLQADYDGNGTFEHTETWQTQIDGSQIGTIQEVNASGAVVAKGTETISADGTITTLKADTDNNGTIDHIDSSLTHTDGSITETITDYNADGSFKQTVVNNVSANGQDMSVVTTKAPTTAGAPTTATAVMKADGLTARASDANVTATINGDFNTLSLSGGTDTATVTGKGNVFNLGANVKLSVSGGSASIVNANGVGDDVTIGSATVNVGAGAYVNVIGNSNTLKVASGGTGVVLGTGNTLTATGTGAVVSNASGTGNTANISNGTVWMGSGGSMTVNGNNNVLNMGQTNGTYTVNGTGNTLNASQTGEKATMSNGTVNLGANASLTLTGSNDVINVGANSTISVTGTSETFVFSPNFGKDTITGYQASGTGADQINIDHNVFADWATLLSHTTQSGADTIITADANDVITLKNTTVSSLQQSNFHFT